MKEYFQRFYDFLVQNDFQTLHESIRQLDWRVIAKSPFTWLIALPILIFIVWTKRYKALIGLASLAAFMLLLQYTLPPTNQQIAFKDLLSFLGGCVAIISVNIYFLFIRD